LEGELERGTPLVGDKHKPARAATTLKDEFRTNGATNAAAVRSGVPNIKASELSERRTWTWRQQGLALLTLAFSDLLLTSLFWAIAILLQSVWGQGPLLTEANLTYIAISTAVWLGLRALLGLYPGYGLSPVEELRRQVYATVASLAILSILALALQTGEQLSRLLIALSFLERLFLAPVGRHFVKWGMAKVGLWGKPAVIVGAGQTGKHLVRTLKEEWGLGLRPVACFDSPLNAGRVNEEMPNQGSVTNTLSRAREQGVDTAIFAMPDVRREYVLKYVDIARRRFPHVIVIPNLGEMTYSAVTARGLGSVFGIEIKQNLLNPWNLRVKRMLDLAAAVVGGILVLPLLLTISLLVKISSPGPVLYKAKRLGKDQKLFSCLKFRTMAPAAEAKLQRMLAENPKMREEYLVYHKLRDDPRVTSVGRFLRKTSLDELPQLWNVLRGEMSLVGPRPYLPRESEEIGDSQDEVLRVPPGMTGPWQVAGRSHASFKERVQMDANYVRDWSVWLDYILLARTVEILFFRRKAAY
jgi:Undecaprenyl-phosphate galactose phosphotransferase WbaP